jgi:hypothetical protein
VRDTHYHPCNLDACTHSGAVQPGDFVDAIRAAVLEAEEIVETQEVREPDSIWHERAKQYAMGLRTAARLLGMREGYDPVTRARYPNCTGNPMPCDNCRAKAGRT